MTLPDRPFIHIVLSGGVEAALEVAGLTPSFGYADEENERALQRIADGGGEAWYVCDQGLAKVTVTPRNEGAHGLDADVVVDLRPWWTVNDVSLRATRTVEPNERFSNLELTLKVDGVTFNENAADNVAQNVRLDRLRDFAAKVIEAVNRR